MKVIFLDHDGVICLPKQWGIRFNSMEDIFDPFDPNAVSVLNEILKETDAEIVISSDWKYHANLKYMQDYYIKQGVIRIPIGFTEDVPSDNMLLNLNKYRESAILNSINIYNPDEWVAVDDINLRNLKNFVLCHPNIGLLENGIKEKIIELLNGKHEGDRN